MGPRTWGRHLPHSMVLSSARRWSLRPLPCRTRYSSSSCHTSVLLSRSAKSSTFRNLCRRLDAGEGLTHGRTQDSVGLSPSLSHPGGVKWGPVGTHEATLPRSSWHTRGCEVQLAHARLCCENPTSVRIVWRTIRSWCSHVAVTHRIGTLKSSDDA